MPLSSLGLFGPLSSLLTRKPADEDDEPTTPAATPRSWIDEYYASFPADWNTPPPKPKPKPAPVTPPPAATTPPKKKDETPRTNFDEMRAWFGLTAPGDEGKAADVMARVDRILRYPIDEDRTERAAHGFTVPESVTRTPAAPLPTQPQPPPLSPLRGSLLPSAPPPSQPAAPRPLQPHEKVQAPANADTFMSAIARVQQRMAKAGAPVILTGGAGDTAGSLAFDVKGKASRDPNHRWDLLGQIAKEEGLVWGGDFKTPDRGRVQLPTAREEPGTPQGPLDVTKLTPSPGRRAAAAEIAAQWEDPNRPWATPPTVAQRGAAVSGLAKGQVLPGNIDLAAQPRVKNKDGTVSTVKSFSVNFDGKEYLLPMVMPDGRVLNQQDAIAEFQKTGRHLGVFDSPDAATAYAKQLHEDYAAGKYQKPEATMGPELRKPLGAWDATKAFFDTDPATGLPRLSKKGEALIPFVGSAAETADLVNVIAAARRMRDNTYVVRQPGERVSQRSADQALLEDYFSRNADEQTQGTTRGYKIANVIANLPPFAVEFLMTGGAYTAANEATVAAARKGLGVLLKDAAEKVAVKGGEAAVEAAAEKAGKKTLGTLAKETAGWAVGSAVQTAANVPRLAASTAGYMAPTLKTQLNPEEQKTEAQLEGLVSEGDQLRPQYDAAVAAFTPKRAAFEQAQAQLEAVRPQVDAAQAEEQQLAAARKQELDELRAGVSHAQATLDTHLKAWEAAGRPVVNFTALKNEEAAVKQQTDAFNARLGAVQEELDAFSTRTRQLIDPYQAKLAELQAQKAALDPEFAALQAMEARAGALRDQALPLQRKLSKTAAQDLHTRLQDWHDDSFLPALAKGFGAQFVEVSSERTGELPEEILGFLKGTKPGAKIAAAAAPTLDKIAGFKTAIVNEWMKLSPRNSLGKALAMLKEGTAWNGMIGEIFEERVGDVMRDMLPIGQPGDPQSETTRLFTGQTRPAQEGETLSSNARVQAAKDLWQQLLVEAPAFAAPGAFGKILTALPVEKLLDKLPGGGGPLADFQSGLKGKGVEELQDLRQQLQLARQSVTTPDAAQAFGARLDMVTAALGETPPSRAETPAAGEPAATAVPAPGGTPAATVAPGAFDPAAIIASLPEDPAARQQHPLVTALDKADTLHAINGVVPGHYFSPEQQRAIEEAGVQPQGAQTTGGKRVLGYNAERLSALRGALTETEAPPPPVTGFTTSQGSTYTVDGARTSRAKTKTGERFGPSDATIYLTPDVAERVQLYRDNYSDPDGPTTARPEILDDGSIAIVVRDRATGQVRDDLTREVPGETTPKVGLHPFEVWHKDAEGHRRWHVGNAITKLEIASAETKPAAPASRPAVSQPAPQAQVPFMITRAMREQLRARGHSDAAIDAMTPADAHARLAEPKPTAVFAFHQPDETGQQGEPKYHVRGGPLDRSTVSADDLRKHGIEVPETPAFVPRPASRPAVSQPAKPIAERTGDELSDEEIAAALAEAMDGATGAEPAAEPTPEPARSPEQEAIEQERAALAAEADDLIRQLKAKLNRVGANTPLDPEVLDIVVKLARNYIKRGILHFREAAQQFRADFGEDKRAEDAFAVAWKAVNGDTANAAVERVKKEQVQRLLQHARVLRSYRELARDPKSDADERVRLGKQLDELSDDYHAAWDELAKLGDVDRDALTDEVEAAADREYAKEAPEPEVPDRPRRNAMNTHALEDDLSAGARVRLEEMFKAWNRSWDLRHIREAMEIYQLLLDQMEESDDATARERADALRDAMEAYFSETPPKGAARAVSEAALAGLQHITGQEDPDWNQLLENEVFASSQEAGDLIFNTLDPKTAEFDIQEFNTAFGMVEFRRNPHEIFPEPKQASNLWEGRPRKKRGTEDEWTGLGERAGVPVLSQAEGARRLEEWKAEAKRLGETQDNSGKVILAPFDRTGIVSQPWVDAGYSVRRFDIRSEGEGGTAEDLTDFGKWMDEIEEILSQGYQIVGILAQPPCTSFTSSGAHAWPRHDQPGYIDPKTGLTWLERTYGTEAAKHFDTPTEYGQTLVAVVKLMVAQANPRFYVMENPVGRITKLTGLPEPSLKFNPDDYGQPYTKATQLWGEFNHDLPQARVGGLKQEGGRGSIVQGELSSDDVDERAETPEGFAYAFFMANQALAQEDWQNQTRPAQYDHPPGEKYVPERPDVIDEEESEPEGPEVRPVITFRSGNQRAPADLAGFIKAGHDVGVTALGMTGPVREQFVAHIADGGNGFVDSGAFGTTKIEDGRGVPGINFDAVLSVYTGLADDVEKADGEAANLYVVAPDVAPVFVDKNDPNTIVKRGADGAVPRSFPEETKEIQDEYADQITALLGKGINVVVPVQVGPTMAARAVEVFRQFDGAMIGLPGNMGAISDEQLDAMLAMIKESRVDHYGEYGFHFLGVGETNKRQQHLIEKVHAVFPLARITTDSSRANAFFVEGRPAQNELNHRIGRIASGDAGEEVDDAATNVGLAGQFFRGEWENFTKEELQRVFDATGISRADALRAQKAGKVDELFGGSAIERAQHEAIANIKANPKPLEPGETIESEGMPPVLVALYEIAYDRSAASTKTLQQARTEVIATQEPKGIERAFQFGSTAMYEGKPVTVQEFYPTHPSTVDPDTGHVYLPAGPAYRIIETLDGGVTHLTTVLASSLSAVPKAPPKSRPATSQAGGYGVTRPKSDKLKEPEHAKKYKGFKQRLGVVRTALQRVDVAISKRAVAEAKDLTTIGTARALWDEYEQYFDEHDIPQTDNWRDWERAAEDAEHALRMTESLNLRPKAAPAAPPKKAKGKATPVSRPPTPFELTTRMNGRKVRIAHDPKTDRFLLDVDGKRVEEPFYSRAAAEAYVRALPELRRNAEEDLSAYQYLIEERREDRARLDPDEEYGLLEAAVAAIDGNTTLVREMPIEDLRAHLKGIEALREETGKYALSELDSELPRYDTSADVLDRLEGVLDRELKRREGQGSLFEEPTVGAAKTAGEPDGFEKTFTEVSRRKVGGGTKTSPADEITWEGAFDGVTLTIRTTPRTLAQGESFLTSSNQRISGDSKTGQAGHFIDAQIVDGDLTLDQADALQRYMQDAADREGGRRVRVRLRGEKLGREGGLGTKMDVRLPSERAADRDEAPETRDYTALSDAELKRLQASGTVEEVTYAHQELNRRAGRSAPSWKVEINDGKSWSSNQLRYATKREAEAAGSELMSRWMGAQSARAVETTDQPNRRWDFAQDRSVELQPLAPTAEPPASRSPVSQPAQAPAAEPAKSPERLALEAERERLLKEREELVKSIKKDLGRVGANTPLDPALVAKVVKLARNFVQTGILNFREAALAFRETFGEDADAERYFEVAWPLTQELAKGTKFGPALKAVLAQTQPTVAAEVEAYTKEQGAAPDAEPNGPVAGGETGESGSGGRGGRRPAGAGGGTGTGSGAASRPQSRPGARTGKRGAVPGPGEDPGLTPALYTITDADAIGTGSKPQRVARNLAAIRILKQLATEQRGATPDEQRALVQYVGWGGLSRIFEPWKDDVDEEAAASDAPTGQYWYDQNRILEGLLTREEYKRARNSTQNAHYTSPVVVRAMWDAIRHLGVTHGSFLEPSAGIGHFVGLAPADMRGGLTFALVEKDPITAQIAQALYPGAFTQNAGFEDAQLPSGHFAVAGSNVPFGDIPITDTTFQGPAFLRRRIHNYFFAKALDRVAPGGLVAFITSHGTMDATDETGQRVREYLASRADLLGAIRLPFTAFKGNAGTEVVTDIIFLRKRLEGEEAKHAGPWMAAPKLEGLKNKKGETFAHPVNEYFVAHPEMVLGEHTATGKMRQANTYNVEPTGHLETQLKGAIASLPADAINLDPTGPTLEAFTDTMPPVGTRPFEFLEHEGRIAQIIDGKVTPVDLSATDAARVMGLLPLRTALRNVYDLMASPDATTEAVEAAQADLTKRYDAFVKKFGYISEEKNWAVFREDPDIALLLSLEDYDVETEKAEKTAVFTTRTMGAERAARSASSPDQALQLVLGEKGRLDFDRAGELLGISAEEATTQLHTAGLIIDTPGGWQLPAQYLSGNVRVKLAEAEAAAKLDPRYEEAVERLKAVLPPDLEAHKINVRLGAMWIPPEMVQDFIAHIANTRQLQWTVTSSPFSAKWHIDGPAGAHTATFATPDVNLKTLLMAALNDRRITIRDAPDPDTGARAINTVATALARNKREELHKAFSEWLFNENPERRQWAVRTYNDRYNALVEPHVDGSYLTFPGMAEYWQKKIRSHQRNGIARALQFGNTLAAWVVGAGKSLWMAGTGMELRRLGLARKPLYVVPNHLISQAPSEFLQYYPNAKLLIARPEDLEKDNRKRFTARIASGNWDGIIMPMSAFVKVSISREAEQAYHTELLDEIETAIIEAYQAEVDEQRGTSRRSNQGSSRTPPHIKQLENMRDKIQATLQKLLNRPKDDMLSFEQLGVDAMFVDEAHYYKNLYFHTRQQAAGIPSNTGDPVQRATDMYLKTRYINKLTNYRNVFFATGTPVSNSMAEIYVMQKLLQEQTLEQAGLKSFDAWLQQFGLITIKAELDPSGTGISARARLSEFRNLPDLGQMFRQVADVKMIDDLPEIKEARPPLQDDEVTAVAVPATERQLMYLKELEDRADALDPRQRHLDNMAAITQDGRLSALDQRLIDRTERDDPGSKINVMVQDAADILNEHKANRGTILVFMDRGTPGSEIRPATKEVWDPAAGARVKRPLTPAELLRGYDLYTDFKRKLVRTGAVKASEVAFIHDVNRLPKKQRDAARKALFRKVREGTIRVLLGSSDTMATGMNVQDRLVAELNADPTYKPSETEQRYGRILRQGNWFATPGKPLYDPNFRVKVRNYITQGAGTAFGMDAYMWQLNEAKAKFLADFYKGKIEQRNLSLDLDNTVLTAGTFKAVATGNPLIIEQGKAAEEAERLRLVHAGWEDQVREARWMRGGQQQILDLAEKSAKELTQLNEPITPRLERVTATIGDEVLEGPKVIGEKLLALVQEETRGNEAHPGLYVDYYDPKQLGTMRGLNIWLVANKHREPMLVLRHPDDPPRRYAGNEQGKYAQREFSMFVPSSADTARGGLDWRQGQGLASEMDNEITRVAASVGYWNEEARRAKAQLETFDKLLNTPFPQQAEYDQAQARLDDINRQLGLGEEQEIETEGEGTEGEEDLASDMADGGEGGTPSGRGAPMLRPGEILHEGPNFPQTPAEMLGRQLHAIEFPELVDLARDLINTPRVVRRFRNPMTRGMFGPQGIRLTASLFKAGQERQLAATLAHEIGHLVDWLPDKTLKRGNLLGRLRSLRSFMQGEFTAADGTTIKNKAVRAELIKLSADWRPWDPDKAPPFFKKYRNSARELYADALSVLLNNPGKLKTDAPIFFKQFEEHIDQKPEVKAAFIATWEQMAGTRDELIERRREGVRGMFGVADAESVARDRAKAGQTTTFAEHRMHLMAQHVDKHAPFIARLKADRQAGKTIASEDNPFYALSERTYRLGGGAKAWLQRHIVPLKADLDAHGIDWKTFGEVLMYQRVGAGDRTEIANPRGYAPKEAQELYESLLKKQTPEQRAVLIARADAFRAAVKAVAKEAYEAGLYTDATWKKVDENQYYATFRTIEHLKDPITSRIHTQIGTLKDIANPADQTILRTMVTLRATEHQKVKVKAFDYLMANHRGDIKNALVTNDKKRKPLEPTGEHADLRLVTYYVKGRLMGKYVDPYIADSLDNHTVEENSKVISALRMINDPFRRVYTTYNPGFMGFNVYRDFIRTWKNTPNVSMLQLMKRYWQAVPLARLRAFGLSEKPTAAQLEAWEHLLTAEEKGILSTTFNDTFHGHTIEETQIANILARYGAGSFNKARHPLLRPIVALANGMRNAGDFFETLPKAAMMYEYMGEGSVADLTAEQRHFLRTRVGSPDFLAGGTWTPVTNNLFLFSNAVAQGWRTDLEVAVGPTTRSGFVWKTAAVNLVPKILMMAALMAAAGSAAGGGDDDANWLERALAKVPFLARAGQLLRRASRYDLTNYIVIPFGEDAEGNTIYLRLPQDDTGRFLGGLAWKLLEAAVGRRDEGVLQTIADIVNYTQGQIPSMAPIFDILSTAGQYAAKQNPYDYFRGRNLLTEDEQKARFAKGSQNWDAFGKFLGWEAKQFGADIIYKFYGGESKPTTRTPGQVFLDLPVISNAVGRFLRVTNYGELEHRRDVGAGIEADRAAGRLAENKAMNRKIAEYQALPAAQQNPRTQIRMAQEVQHELYASERDPKKRAEITRRLQSKFRRSLVRGESDTIADALLSASSNPEKVAILLDARQSMRREVFDTWLRDAVRQKVVSQQLRDLLHKRLRERALVAQ